MAIGDVTRNRRSSPRLAAAAALVSASLLAQVAACNLLLSNSVLEASSDAGADRVVHETATEATASSSLVDARADTTGSHDATLHDAHVDATPASDAAACSGNTPSLEGGITQALHYFCHAVAPDGSGVLCDDFDQYHDAGATWLAPFISDGGKVGRDPKLYVSSDYSMVASLPIAANKGSYAHLQTAFGKESSLNLTFDFRVDSWANFSSADIATVGVPNEGGDPKIDLEVRQGGQLFFIAKWGEEESLQLSDAGEIKLGQWVHVSLSLAFGMDGPPVVTAALADLCGGTAVVLTTQTGLAEGGFAASSSAYAGVGLTYLDVTSLADAGWTVHVDNVTLVLETP
jgi:hypothetical protein